MTGKLWSGQANPRDLTGRIGREAQAAKDAADQAAEVARLRAEGLPGSDAIMTWGQIEAAAATGRYAEGEQIGLTSHGQPVIFSAGEPVCTDARVAVQRGQW